MSPNTPISGSAAHTAVIHYHQRKSLTINCTTMAMDVSCETAVKQVDQIVCIETMGTPVDDVSTSIEVESPILRMLPLP